MQCMRVDLPEPDGPITAVNRPRSNSTRDPVEGPDDGVALAVGLDQVDGPGRRRPRRARPAGAVVAVR